VSSGLRSSAWYSIDQTQRNSGGTQRPELLLGIESCRLMGPAHVIYFDTLNQAIPACRNEFPSPSDSCDVYWPFNNCWYTAVRMERGHGY
jgi:hypothetical protein